MLLEYHMELDTVLGLPTIKDQNDTHLIVQTLLPW